MLLYTIRGGDGRGANLHSDSLPIAKTCFHGIELHIVVLRSHVWYRCVNEAYFANVRCLVTFKVPRRACHAPYTLARVYAQSHRILPDFLGSL